VLSCRRHQNNRVFLSVSLWSRLLRCIGARERKFVWNYPRWNAENACVCCAQSRMRRHVVCDVLFSGFYEMSLSYLCYWKLFPFFCHVDAVFTVLLEGTLHGIVAWYFLDWTFWWCTLVWCLIRAQWIFSLAHTPLCIVAHRFRTTPMVQQNLTLTCRWCVFGEWWVVLRRISGGIFVSVF